MTGTEEDFDALYLRACPPLVGLLTAIGGSHADAEEIAQDAFVKLLLGWRRLRSYDDPAAWVRRVAVRMLVSRRRRDTVAGRGLARLARRTTTEAAAPSADPVDLDRALATLSVDHRAVLVLHHALGLPVADVADLLGVAPGTVRSRLARARTAVAPLLAEGITDHA